MQLPCHGWKPGQLTDLAWQREHSLRTPADRCAEFTQQVPQHYRAATSPPSRSSLFAVLCNNCYIKLQNGVCGVAGAVA